MKQGTVSIIIGCHNIIHCYFVLRAWRELYKEWPEPWQFICILLHDIGHFGIDYLDDLEAKQNHWRLGASIASKLFKTRGYAFIAGHCEYSGWPQSKLFKADKYSWHLAPFWWVYWNNIVEPRIKCGMKNGDAARDFKANIAKMVESGDYRSTHEFFIERQLKLSTKNTE